MNGVLFENPYERKSESLAERSSKSWGEALSDLASSSQNVARLVDNTQARQVAVNEVYDERLRAIHEATGVQLHKPHVLPRERLSDVYGRFDGEVDEVAQKFPDHAELFSGIKRQAIEDEATKRARAADAQFEEDLQAPELGVAGRLVGSLAGGLAGAVQDPNQVAVSLLGGGVGVGRTLAVRIASAVGREAAVSAAVEVPLQAISARNRREIGLEYGVDDFARNVTIAGLLGGGFGGVGQGVGEALGALSKTSKKDIPAIATRIEAGEPTKQDIVDLAEAGGVELSPERLEEIDRAFELDAIETRAQSDFRQHFDDIEGLEPADVDTVSQSVALAAARHLEDPDNFPAPEIVEAELLRQLERSGEVDRILGTGNRGQGVDLDDTFDAPFEDTLAPVPLRAGDDVGAPDPSIYNNVKSSEVRRDAELRAGKFIDPEIDGDGNLVGSSRLLPIDEGDGRVRLVPAKEAVEAADRPAFYSDLLEACQL